MTLPTGINRHIVGFSAVIAALAVLAYTASTVTSRRVASLPETGFAIAHQAPNETESSNENFLVQLKQIPPNAYGSARESGESIGQKITSGIKAVLPSIGSNSAQTESKNWTDEDWRIAQSAVANRRKDPKEKSNDSASAQLDTVWQPPEEIANRPGNQSR
jgi:hypothetical protein